MFLLILALRKVYRGDIREIDLSIDKLTEARNPVPMIRCYSEECDKYAPRRIACVNNAPADTPDFNWNCNPINWSKRHTVTESKISCEPWGDPSEPYVVDGSCYVELKIAFDQVRLKLDNSIYPRLIPVVVAAIVGLDIYTLYLWTRIDKKKLKTE